jgi:hypothetical protein
MYSLYGYVPSETVCLIVIVLFALSTGSPTSCNVSPRELMTLNTAAHVGEAVHKRTYWLLPTAVLAGMIELIGWFGRLWSSQNVCEDGYFVQSVAVLEYLRFTDKSWPLAGLLLSSSPRRPCLQPTS